MTSEDKETLFQKNLADNGHSYWKFSQHKRGTSVEKPYAEYVPGKITVAKDPDKLLSFVSDDNISGCFMYGDQLTKFVMTDDVANFSLVRDVSVHYIGCGLGEYETERLLVEKNYNMGEIATIKLLFSMCKRDSQLITIFRHGNTLLRGLEDHLRIIGFTTAADEVKYLEGIYLKYHYKISFDDLIKLLIKEIK